MLVKAPVPVVFLLCSYFKGGKPVLVFQYEVCIYKIHVSTYLQLYFIEKDGKF